jgi:hypothetical protein
MAQILLSLIVFTAALVLLINSWRKEKRLFAATALVVLLTSGVITGALIRQVLIPTPLLSPENIVVSLREANPTENGVRLSGTLENLSDQRVASVVLLVVALSCDNDECQELDRDQVNILLQLPPGRSYPFNVTARMTGLRGIPGLRWELTPLKVTIY